MNATSPPTSMPTGPRAGMAPPSGSSRFKPIDPLGVLRKHVWLFLGLVVLGLGFGLGTWYISRTFNPWYSSSSLVNITPVNPGAWSGLGDEVYQMRLDTVRAALENEQLRLRSEHTLRSAMERSMLRDTKWFQSFVSADGQTVDAHSAMRMLGENMLRTRVVPGSTQMEVSVRTARPEDARPILSAVLETYVSHVRAEREDESRGVRAVYVAERDRVQQEIERLSQRIERYPRETRMATLETEFEEAQTVRAELTGEYLELQIRLDQARQQQQQLEQRQMVGELEPSARLMQEIEAGGTVQRLDQRIQALRTDRRRLESRLGPEHHRIRDLDQQIAAAQAEKQQVVERMVRERRAAEVEQVGRTVDVIEARLARLEPEVEQSRLRVQDLKERLAEHQGRYDQLREQLRQARQDRHRYDEQLTSLRVQSTRPDAVRAQVWSRPSSPKLASPKAELVIPAVALLVVGIGAGGVFLKESLDQRLRTPADIKLLANAELLGVVPRAHEDLSSSGRIEHAVADNPAGLLAEAFRQVRTALMGKMDRHGYKSILVVGGQPGAGTTAVAHNLARSLSSGAAGEGRRVLLIDANIRRPAQHTLHGLSETPGLIDLLKYHDDSPAPEAAEAAVTIEGTSPDVFLYVEDIADTQSAVTIEGTSLDVLPVGEVHQASPELLGSARMGRLLEQLEARYDVIVLDAPPALLSSDTTLLARHVDAVAVVINAERDLRGMIERMIRQFEGQRPEILGMILNNVRANAGGYFRQSYREFYRYNPSQSDAGLAQRNGRAPDGGLEHAPSDSRKAPVPQAPIERGHREPVTDPSTR